MLSQEKMNMSWPKGKKYFKIIKSDWFFYQKQQGQKILSFKSGI